MGVFNLPKELAVVNSVCSDAAVRPSTDDDLVREDGTDGIVSGDNGSFIGGCSASGDDSVVVGVPD